MKPLTSEVLADRANRPEDLIAAGEQVDMIFRPGEKTLSLRAQKLWHLLVKEASVDLGEAKLHSIDIEDLRELGHLRQEDRVDMLRELMQTIVEVRVPSPNVKNGTQVLMGPLLSHVARDDDESGKIEWEFSKALRRIFANSDHFAILSRRAVMAFESRYALRLYEIVMLRSKRDWHKSEVFDLADLRSRFGVPVGKLSRWTHFRQFALDPAIAEVNQLAGFEVSYEPIKKRRSYVAVKLIWKVKSDIDRLQTKRELDGPKVGRKARRNGTAEQLAIDLDELPAPEIQFPEGSIRYTVFQAIALENLPQPAPDIDWVADQYRQWAKKKSMLCGSQVTEHFASFCRAQKPAR